MKWNKLFVSTVCGLLLLTACRAPKVAEAKPDDDYKVKDHYTKSERMVPMRDGAKLFTIVYEPNDQSQKYPILMTRTAYGIPPYGPDNYRTTIGPNNEFAKEGYIVVYQDSRGKFKSEGEFIHHRPIV